MQVKNAQTPRNSTVSFGLQNRVPRVQVLLPLPKNTCHFCGGCFFVRNKKGLEPVRVCALRKQFCKLFLAQSARRELKFKEFRSPSGKKLLCNFGQVLLPLPKRKTSLSRCLSFWYVAKLALRGTRSVPGIAAEAPPAADTARR